MRIKVLSIICILFASITANAQIEINKAPENWFNLDWQKDHVLGVGSERAYEELLKGRTSKTVIVAVIDDGTDYNHEDLKDIIWTNEKEIPGNGKDDDGNGYIDDVHGWNFIGGKNGDVKEDSYELTRLFVKYSKKFDEVDVKKLSKADKKEYKYFEEKVKPAFYEQYYENNSAYNGIYKMTSAIEKIEKALGDVTVEKLKNYKTTDRYEELAVKNMIAFLGYGMSMDDVKAQFKEALDHYAAEVDYRLNTSFNPRYIVGDDYENTNERGYGNNHYLGPNGDHGTHVAGIIAAIRNNSKGIKGVADNVKIMIIRVVPDGDERDKDVANGIRYAADNGAQVINMSFGKSFPYAKKAVDEAVQYAVSKDVLLVHAAGNDAKNTDVEENYPKDMYLSGKKASSWIEVGASNTMLDSNVCANFSNYGKKNVDLFAPGVNIESTTPKNNYASFSGTSMASPVTAGVAALIRSYFPELTADQVKDILMKTVTKVDMAVYIPGTEKAEKFSKLCQSGGVVNAYEAVKLAMKTKGKKK